MTKEFDAFAAKDLSEANAALEKKKLQPVHAITREEWDKANGESGGGSAAGTVAHAIGPWDRLGLLLR